MCVFAQLFSLVSMKSRIVFFDRITYDLNFIELFQIISERKKAEEKLFYNR